MQARRELEIFSFKWSYKNKKYAIHEKKQKIARLFSSLWIWMVKILKNYFAVSRTYSEYSMAFANLFIEKRQRDLSICKPSEEYFTERKQSEM